MTCYENESVNNGGNLQGTNLYASNGGNEDYNIATFGDGFDTKKFL